MGDHRGGRIVLLAHCLLNQNAKVAGLSTHPGACPELVSLLVDAGAGIVQLPCPECRHLGPARPLGTDTVEQYDTPAYRAACRQIASQAAADARSFADAGYRIVGVAGVEGSPSCGVDRVPRLADAGKGRLVPGMGIFVEELAKQLGAAGLDVPLLGIPESPRAGELASALARLRALLEQSVPV